MSANFDQLDDEMADPSKYSPGYSFSDYQASNPALPLPADEVDTELAAIAVSMGQAVDAIRDVRRSDGALKNLVVTYDSLNADMKGRLAAIGFEGTDEQIDAIADAVLATASIVATGGNTPRLLSDHFADLLNPTDFGAIVGGVTDGKTAIDDAADEDDGAVFLPRGVWKYGTDDTGGVAAGKRFYGPGVAKTGANKRARSFGYLDDAPASFGDTGSVVTAFNGDFSKSLDVREFRVSGSDTLGNPASGYYQKHETAAIYSRGYMGSNAGQNLATDWTDGRTGWSFRQDQHDHFGQGDFTAWTVGINVWNNKADGTHFLAHPAGNVMNGGITAWTDHVNMVVGEFYVYGQTYDVNGTGFALHFNRNNGTGSQEAMWRGISIISSGSQPMDFSFGARGKVKRGLDLGEADFGTDQAAIALSANQRVYGNVTYANTGSANPLASGYKVFSAYGSAWYRFGSVTSAWDFNNPINLISGNVLKVNNVQVVGARDTGWTAMTGTPDESTAYATSSVTLAQLAGRVMALQTALTTHGLIGA